jgi:dynein assembly factor with WDR repeat domains 1
VPLTSPGTGSCNLYTVNSNLDPSLFSRGEHFLSTKNCRFITGSYDRTCKVWDTATGDLVTTLEGPDGHKNVVYAIAFNNPFGNKIVTGSFDKTAKLWDTETGKLHHTYKGHETEIVCLSFNPAGDYVATGSMDHTAKVWNVETGDIVHTLMVS